MAGMFRFLPPRCKSGHCDCTEGRHFLYRSRSCYQGTCSHASQNMHCAVAPLPAPAPKGDER